MSQLQSRFTTTASGPYGRTAAADAPPPHDSLISPYHTQLTSLAAAAAAAAGDAAGGPAAAIARPTSVLPLPPARPVEPTHFHWNTSSRRKQQQRQLQQQRTSDASDCKPPPHRLNCTVRQLQQHRAVA